MAQYEQQSFEYGEVGEAHIARADLKVRGASLRRARNLRILVSGAMRQRPGTERVATIAGDGIVQFMVDGAEAFILVLTHQRLDVYAQANRALVQSVTGCAWTLAMLTDADDPLVVDPYAKEAWVYHPALPTQVIKRSAAGAWSVAAESFADGLGNSIRQPYYRFADQGVTLTPSALTGAGITLECSSAYFDAAHDELRLRLQGREVQIKTVTDADTVTADVIQGLHPTRTLPVASSAGFDVGSIVDGKDSFARAEVAAVPSGTSLTLLMQEFTDFLYDAATSTGEVITGPNGSTRNTGASSLTSNAAVLDWDEQAISAYRGYPATGCVHKNRRWMARLPQVQFGVLASALGDFRDFHVGVNDADAIFEEMGDANAGVIRHVFSSEQLLIFTGRGLYYYPESETNPIRPTSWQVLKVGPDGASTCRPVQISEGVMFIEAGGKSALLALPTGDVRRSWRTADVSLLSAHLLDQPRALAYVSGSPLDPERYVYAVNTDGSLAVVYYHESAEVFGWTGWDTRGAFRSATAHLGECWALVRRAHGASTVYSLEVFGEDRLVDAAVDVDPVAALQGDATSQTILTPSGEAPAEKVYRCAALAGATCSLMVGDAYIGEVVLNGSGDFGGPATEATMTLGFGFEVEVTPWPPRPAEDERALRRKRRITRVTARWRGRYIAVGGDLQPVYRGGEDTNEAPPLRDEDLRVPVFTGWAHEPEVTITHPYPGPFELLGLTLEVAE